MKKYLIHIFLIFIFILAGCVKQKRLTQLSIETQLSHINKALLAKDFSFAHLMLKELEKKENVRTNSTLMQSILSTKAYCLIMEKNYSEATKVLDKAISTYPKNPKNYVLRASVFKLTGELDKAISDLKIAEQIAPKDVIIKYNLGCIYIEKENFSMAVKKFKQVLNIDPYLTDAMMNLGYSLFFLGNYGEAIYYFKKAASIDNNDPDIYFNIAFGYEKLHDYDSAISYYSKAIDINSLYLNGFINRGLLYLNLGKKELACVDFRTACNLGACEKYNELKDIMVCD